MANSISGLILLLVSVSRWATYLPGSYPQTSSKNGVEIRREFASIYVRLGAKASLERSGAQLKGDHAAEFVSLLCTFSLPRERMVIAERMMAKFSGTTSSLLRRATFSNNMGDQIEAYRELGSQRPYDFLPFARVAFLTSVSKGGSHPYVEPAIRRVEELTNYHPICLRLRGAQYRIVTIREPNYLQQTKKCYPFFKLHDFALRLIDKDFVASDETREVYEYLKKKGITPPEPTAAQYAAVKKRGWAFNKQMLEPFKKVD